MHTGFAKRIVAAVLAGVVGSGLAIGTPLAQGGKPSAPGAPAPPAAAAPAPAAGTQSPAWLRGRWAERCGAPQFVEFGADFVAEYRSGGATASRAEATFAVAGEVVVITVGRALTPGSDAPPPGMVVVLRRAGAGLRLIGFDDPRDPNRSPPRETMQRCA